MLDLGILVAGVGAVGVMVTEPEAGDAEPGVLAGELLLGAALRAMTVLALGEG